MSSVAHRVLERLDAEISETDGHGRPASATAAAALPFLTWELGAHQRRTGCHLVSGWPTEVKRVRR
ncbi:MAG: hypothetical protein QOH82_275 [Mycobacterium sp.]|nr:hypothetical protein [Mycobacterium sp.]